MRLSTTAMIAAGLLLAANESAAKMTQDNGANDINVRISRASDYLGYDVTGSDGQKVGDIVDFAFDVKGTPELRYVLTMTGGFLDVGGDVRAIPAAEVVADNDSLHINLTKSQYDMLPVLPANRRQFLLNSANAARIERAFDHNSSDFRAKANGTVNDGSLVFFSQMKNQEAYSDGNARLGYLDDAWINLAQQRVPYVEIRPNYSPFRTGNPNGVDYAIPVSLLDAHKSGEGFVFSVTPADLTGAKSVSESDRIRMLQDGQVGKKVLLVTLPRRDVSTQNMASNDKSH